MGANFVHPGGGKGARVLGNKFVGLLGSFGVWDRALTPAQLATACATGPRTGRPRRVSLCVCGLGQRGAGEGTNTAVPESPNRSESAALGSAAERGGTVR